MVIGSSPLRQRDRGIRADIRWFVVGAYAVTWATVSPLVFASLTDAEVPPILHAAGALGPTLAALTVLAVRAPNSVRSETRRMLHWRSVDRRAWWWAVTPIGFAAFGLVVTALVSDLPGIEALAQDRLVADGAWLWLVLPAFAYGIFEEPGWRGFLLPRLQTAHDAAGATWRLWLIWAAWHTPFFVYRYDLLAVPAVVGTMYFGAVWLTGLTNTAGGSILPAMIWHVLYDLTMIVPDQMPSIYPVAASIPVVVAALWLGRRYGGEHLAPRPRTVIGPSRLGEGGR